MELEQYYSNNRKLYSEIMNYIEDTSEMEDSYITLLNFFKANKYKENRIEISKILNMISKIVENHHRDEGFENKIEKIIRFFSTAIHQFFTNSEIFNIFKNNKKIMVFLFKEKIIFMEEFIYEYYACNDYNTYNSFYFFPELASFLERDNKLERTKKKMLKINPEIFNNFEQKRMEGENDSYICQLIRNDLIEEFVIYTCMNNISLKKQVKPSIFETNMFLLKKNPTLIEYAAFFGSIQIIRYLCYNKVELEPTIWIYAIHSQNAELIHLLEDYHVSPVDCSFEKCLIESIRCHHNNIAEYIINNYFMKDEYENNYKRTYLSYILHNHNYNLINIPDDMSELISIPRSEFSLNLSDLCMPINKFTIPPSVTSIEFGAFEKCTTLKEIIIPPSVTSIDENAFCECTMLTKLTIPSSVTEIDKKAFQRCCSLTEILIPNSIKAIRENAFCDCSMLTNVIIPSSVTLIGEKAFCGCTMLENITISSSVTEIGKEAFKNCSSLIKIKIPSSVKTLRKYLFEGCTSLTEVFIQSKVVFEIGVFTNCISLKKIIVAPNNKNLLLKKLGISTDVIIEKRSKKKKKN